MYDPETKHQNATWLRPSKPKAGKVRMQTLQGKTMLTAFFITNLCQGKKAVNCKFYTESFKRLVG
jgi:hypothetical protein